MAPLLEARNVTKTFGTVRALEDVSLRVEPASVHCLLGDNGAGKSSLIKVLSGVLQPDEGEILIDGAPCSLNSPDQALELGIATVFQDLAVVPIMPAYRNFFLGREPTKWPWPIRRMDARTAKRVTKEALRNIGIDLADVARPILTLSGGQRQCVAIARAIHFGARVLILDEPTSALGVKQSTIVLRYVAEARDRGLGVIFITHNVQHALPVGDVFTILNHGRGSRQFSRGEMDAEALAQHMAGGAELQALAQSVDRPQREDDLAAGVTSEPRRGAHGEA